MPTWPRVPRCRRKPRKPVTSTAWCRAYPIHPEVFTQLYEEWTTIEGFQRTRGVLKLMAKVIYRLWQDNNKDLMILPGSLPLYDGSARNELVYYLGPGWDPVIDRDIDGERAETTCWRREKRDSAPCKPPAVWRARCSLAVRLPR
jgi:predicted AAA+ superfamily ATPase